MPSGQRVICDIVLLAVHSYSLWAVAGFMFGTNVLDKDGISAAVVMAEMAAYLGGHGITLTQQLENLYERYRCAFLFNINCPPPPSPHSRCCFSHVCLCATWSIW